MKKVYAKTYRITEWITSTVEHTVEGANNQREALDRVAEGTCCDGANHGEGDFAHAKLSTPVLIEKREVLP